MCFLYYFRDQLSAAVIILRSLLLKGLNSVLLLKMKFLSLNFVAKGAAKKQFRKVKHLLSHC